MNKKIDLDRAMPSYQRLKTMVRRRIDQMIRVRNYKAWNERIDTGVSVKSHKGKNVRIERRRGEWFQWKATGVTVDNKHKRPLLLRRRRHRLTEKKNLQRFWPQGRKSCWRERSESVQKLPQRNLYESVM